MSYFASPMPRLKHVTALGIATSAVLVPQSLHAGTTNSTMIARANVERACRLQTTNLTFGMVNIISGQVDATTTMTLTCGPAVDYAVAIDNGKNFRNQRRMFGISLLGIPLYLPYQLYRDPARKQVWGATNDTMRTGTTPSSGKVNLTVYGRLPSNFVAATVYSDTVAVTVNF